jgi:hypothetical protein
MPGATVIDVILRLWHDSPKGAIGKSPFTVKKFLVAIGYNGADAWEGNVDWDFDFWALQDPPLVLCDNPEENMRTWQSLQSFVAALCKCGAEPQGRKKGKGKATQEPAPLMAMKAFVKQRTPDGYSQGRRAFCTLIRFNWYKKNKILNKLIHETKIAKCYPFTELMKDPTLLSSDLQLLPSLESEVSQVAAEVLLGEAAFRIGARVDICMEYQSGINLLISNFFWYNHCRKKLKNKVQAFNTAKDELDALLLNGMFSLTLLIDTA